MTKVITALYDDFATAQRAVDALVTAGFPRAQIGVLANDASQEYASRVYNRDEIDTIDEDVTGGEGATFGAVTGALIGLGAMLIPGIGPVIAGGPLVAALIGGGVGAVAGAVTGGVAASLIKLGVDEDEAGYYAEGVRRGGTLLAVETSPEWESRVVDILDDYNPIDRNSRTTTWRADGWSGFNDHSEPYTSAEVEAERERWASGTPTRP